jgi:hypothetical protein
MRLLRIERRPHETLALVGTLLHLDYHRGDEPPVVGHPDRDVGPVLGGSDVGQVGRHRLRPVEFRQRESQLRLQQVGSERGLATEHVDEQFVRERRHGGDHTRL